MMILAENLALHRGQTPVLRGLSFALPAGQMAALTGANGSGKSTLLLALAGMITPGRGRILIDGHTMHADDRAAHIHWIAPDNPLKPTLTVAENLRFWAAAMGIRATHDDIASALHKMQSVHLVNRIAATLSTGQRRRVSLCRLFLAPRPVWLLDEPALALDENAVDDLMALTHAHCGDGGSVIVATHRPERWNANITIALSTTSGDCA